MAWALWGYHPDGITELLAAGGRCSCSCRCCCSGAAARARRNILAVAAITPIVLLLFVALYDRELFEVRYFLVACRCCSCWWPGS